MLQALKKLHSIGILVRDLHLNNYLSGKLIDFSRAWTQFHLFMDASTDSGVCSQKHWEELGVIDVMEAWKELWLEDPDREEVPEHLLRPAFEMETLPHNYEWEQWE